MATTPETLASESGQVSSDDAPDAPLTISEVFQTYVRQLPKESKKTAQPEISKFIRWAGPDRHVKSLIPSEIGEYSEMFSARSSSAEAMERLGSVKLFLSYLKKKGFVDLNLAQHLRIRKSRLSSKRARTRSGTENGAHLTRAGYNDLVKRLEQLQAERVKLADDIQKAAQDGDVRENAPLEAARENQGMVASRIREIEAALKGAVIVDGSQSGDSRVGIGSKVTLVEKNSGSEVSYQLVEPKEASPLSGKISNVSPVGAAILGRQKGDEITVNTPGGRQIYKIVSTT